MKFLKILSIKKSRIDDVYDIHHQLESKYFYKEHPNLVVNNLVISNCGCHAGGIIISQNLNENMPLINVGGKVQTPWSEGQANRHLESMGFVKYDILGLSTLEMFEVCIKQILKKQGIEEPSFEDIKNFYNDKLHPEKMNFDDQKVWENIFHDGRFLGIFQFANSGAQNFCKQVKPKNIQGLSDVTAIFRPATLGIHADKKYLAIKNGEEQIEYVHPIMKDILGKSNGVCVYQEQVAEIVHRMGKNISLDEGNYFRKLLTKKGLGDKALIDKEKILKKFKIGCQEKGLKEEQIEELIKSLELFSFYGFNLSHSIAYCITSYTCAYLLTYYPLEFSIAFLEKEPEDRKDKAISLVKKMGINIDPIDINTSSSHWEIHPTKPNTLLQPFLSLKGLGDSAIEQIINNRPFNSLNDLLFNENILYNKLNKRHLDVLTKCNALDNIWKNDGRFKHLKHFWLSCIEKKPQSQKKLNELIEHYKEEPDYTQEEKIDFINNITGIYPVDLVVNQQFKEYMRRKEIPPISEYKEDVKVCWAIVKNKENKTTKKGKTYYSVDLIDENNILTNIKCWGVNKEKDKLYLHHPYMIRVHHDEQWGFSTNGLVSQAWKILG